MGPEQWLHGSRPRAYRAFGRRCIPRITGGQQLEDLAKASNPIREKATIHAQQVALDEQGGAHSIENAELWFFEVSLITARRKGVITSSTGDVSAPYTARLTPLTPASRYIGDSCDRRRPPVDPDSRRVRTGTCDGSSVSGGGAQAGTSTERPLEASLTRASNVKRIAQLLATKWSVESVRPYPRPEGGRPVPPAAGNAPHCTRPPSAVCTVFRSRELSGSSASVIRIGVRFNSDIVRGR